MQNTEVPVFFQRSPPLSRFSLPETPSAIDHVTGVTIARVDENFAFVPGTEKHFDVDTICLAVGLSPMAQLLKMAGCVMDERTGHDGTTPLCDENGATSVPGIYAVGDVSGIEEASSAMIDHRQP